MRLSPTLIRLLAVLLLMQWGTAFGHCLAMASPAGMLHLDICTAEGLQRVAMTADGQDGPTTHHAAAIAICPACGGPAAVALPTPAVTVAPPILLVQAPGAPPPPSPRPAPTPRCQPPPRAPPTS